MNKIICVDELKKLILKEEKLHPGDKVSYTRLLEIAKKYGLTLNTLCIAIFEVTYTSIRGVVSKGSNAKNIIILKKLVPQMISDSINKREEILFKENLKVGDRIDYLKLKEMSEKYDIPEKVLALDVLGIVPYSYIKIKNRNAEKAIILFKDHEKKDKNKKRDIELELLRKKILVNEQLKIGSKINYEELVRISKKYNMDKTNLAYDVFDLSNSSFNHIKYNDKKNSIILKNYLLEDNISGLREKILKEENLRPYDMINYSTLRRISEKYLIDEKILSVEIFMLTPVQYYNLRHSNANAHILKSEYEEDNGILDLKERIFESENLKVGDMISYSRIVIIQNKYNLTQNDILCILGIKDNILLSLKHNNQAKTPIKDINAYFKLLVLSEILEKGRFYTKSELEEICRANKLSLEEFLTYNLGSNFDYDYLKYLDILNIEGKIRIDNFKKPFSKFVDDNIDIISKYDNEIWDRDELEKLIILSEKFTLHELSEILKKDVYSVKHQLESHGLKCKKEGKGAYILSNN